MNFKLKRQPEIWIISGERDIGKSTFCRKIIDKLHSDKVIVSGIISPGIIEKGIKRRINAKDLQTGLEKELAVFSPGWDKDFPKRDWMLNRETLEWGNRVLLEAVPTEVLFIDELGYQEFENKIGWMASFEILSGKDYRLALVVVRPGFLKQAREMLLNSQILLLEEGDDLNFLAQNFYETISTKLQS